jgi:tRNA A37 methylthiotransferase MiaB
MTNNTKNQPTKLLTFNDEQITNCRQIKELHQNILKSYLKSVFIVGFPTSNFKDLSISASILTTFTITQVTIN